MKVKFATLFSCAVLLLVAAETKCDEKFCNFRGVYYSEEEWNYRVGYACFNYTNTYRLSGFIYEILSQNYTVNNHTYTRPIAKIDEGKYFTFYYNDPNIAYLRASFKIDYFFDMWKDCCKEAENCCKNQMTNENIHGTEEYPCPAIWDGWTCFSPAKAGSVEEKICSKQAYSTESDVCELNSQKECFANGTWNPKTDYSVCAIAPVLRHRHNFNVISLAVTTVVAFPAVIIFYSLRTFRTNLRYILHRNLILVIVIRNLLSIISKKIIILDALENNYGVMEGNSVACRVLAFFENAAKNGMYACMLADGFYLHKLIVRAFASEPSLVYIYIAVGLLSFLPSLAWAIARGIHQATNCWMVDETGDQWIIDGFRIAIIAINFILLLDIVRVMAMKLKRGSTTQQTKATLRATLFLIPLFGVHIIIITNRNMIPGKTCAAEDIYYYISYIIEGLQGVMVALLFCYINGEVRKELKNALRKFFIKYESQFGIKLSKNKDFRRDTAATYVDPYETRN